MKMFYPPRSSCWSIAPLSFRFIFCCLRNFNKLRHEKLPFYERDRNIGKEDEPRNWVQAVVEDMRHFVRMLIQKQTWKKQKLKLRPKKWIKRKKLRPFRVCLCV